MALKPWKLNAPLEFPVGDKTYSVPELLWSDGQRLAAAYLGDQENSGLSADAGSEELFKLAMGKAWDEMQADGLSHRVMFRAGLASITYHLAVLGDDDDPESAAAAVWEGGLDPEAIAATLAAAQKSTDSTQSNSTDAAPATRSRARTSGTKSPATSSTRTKKPAA